MKEPTIQKNSPDRSASTEHPVEDPDEFQRRAAHPDFSVWVAASAGSGKTKVLTDRLLRLLLPRPDGRPGTEPHRILCLTFTKAAASEMALRLNKRLGQWAVMTETKLANDLEETLLGRAPAADEITAARELFARVVDAPGGLKIMTIHSFCQSVLGRFPLEAGLPPHFKPLEEAQAQEMITKARNLVIERARERGESPEGQALSRLAALLNEDAFSSVLENLIQERHQLGRILERFGTIDAIFEDICNALGIAPFDDESDILRSACQSNAFDESGLRKACRVMVEHGTAKTDVPRAEQIQTWLDEDTDGRMRRFDAYADCYLTQKGEIRKTLATKSVLKADEAAGRDLEKEASRIYEVMDHIKAAEIAGATRDLIVLGGAILDTYQQMKTARAALDFDDLINKTLALLKKENMASWVMYKLDGGLDHILVDEAQDTNPEQWQIIQALCEEFFSGYGARPETLRTLFSVGDEKQSIYSFQRAAPEKFRQMQTFFADRVQKADLKWRNELMRVSFRSVPSVLQFVDEVFRPEPVRQGLGLTELDHISYRPKEAGRVEVWPVFSSKPPEERDPWTAAFEPVESASGAMRLAEHIASQIDEWCCAEILPSKGRPVEAGDILILVRRRTQFVNQLIRALKQRKIPVSGVDRMVLKEQLPVQDLLAAARFALLPEDDLSLACLLKSPLIGWDDQALEDLAAPRAKTQSLWSALAADKKHKGVRRYLDSFIALAGTCHPYDFFSRLLQHPCPAAKQGGLYAMTARLGFEAVDPLEEFLSLSLAFERNEIPNLQQFVQDLEQGDSMVKREQEEAGGRVRIMTVHGAKGLQAPIVILPDTIRTRRTPPDSSYRLIWPDKTGLSVPLWSPRSDTDCESYSEVLGRLEGLQDEEYRRLLYVAMTRAEDRLYIGGYTGRRSSYHDESWYNYVRLAAQRLDHMRAEPMPAALPPPHEDEKSKGEKSNGGKSEEETAIPVKYVLENPKAGTVAAQEPEKEGEKEPGKEEESGAETAGSAKRRGVVLDEDTYHWILQDAPPEPEPARPLTPSRPSEEDETPAQSPLAGRDEYRFRRGQVTHKLLQFLPDLPQEKHREAAQAFVKRHGQDLPESVRTGIVTETLAVLENESWAPLFGPRSQAEVSITGMVGKDLVSGQVDRLLVKEDEVWIVDYKTNRPPPRDPADVPALYTRQMGLYSAVIGDIYPDRTVRCFLLWTDGPHLMDVSEM